MTKRSVLKLNSLVPSKSTPIAKFHLRSCGYISLQDQLSKQFSCIGLRSRNANIRFRFQYLEFLGSECKTIWSICTTRFPHKLRLWNRNPNFRLWLHHLKAFGSGSSHPKLLGLRLHSPGFDKAGCGYGKCRNSGFATKLNFQFRSSRTFITSYENFTMQQSFYVCFICKFLCLRVFNMLHLSKKVFGYQCLSTRACLRTVKQATCSRIVELSFDVRFPICCTARMRARPVQWEVTNFRHNAWSFTSSFVC